MIGGVETRCPRCGAIHALSQRLAEHHLDTPFVCRGCRFPFDPHMRVPVTALEQRPVALEYFDGGKAQDHPAGSIRSGLALRGMMTGLIACALAMVAALMELPPDVRPPVCAAIAAAGLAATGLGVAAMRSTEESFVDRALAINGIGLGAMSVVAAAILV